jgi:hypothetical protein
MSKPVKVLVYTAAAVTIAAVLSMGIRSVVIERFNNKPLPVSVRSDIPGVLFEIQNKASLAAFLNEHRFWDYIQNNEKVKKLEIVITESSQPLYRYSQGGKTISSYSFAFSNNTITTLIQIDPQTITDQRLLSYTVQQYFLYMVYDFILQKKPDLDMYMQNNFAVLYFKLSKTQ